MSQFREFWMLSDQLKFGSEVSSDPKDHACIPLVMRIPIQSNAIHVIEYAALEAAQREIAELKDSNENIRNNLLSQTKMSNELLDEKEKLTAALKVAEDALEEYKKESHDLDQVCCDYGVQVGEQEWACCGQPITKAEKAQSEIKKIKKGLG